MISVTLYFNILALDPSCYSSVENKKFASLILFLQKTFRIIGSNSLKNNLIGILIEFALKPQWNLDRISISTTFRLAIQENNYSQVFKHALKDIFGPQGYGIGLLIAAGPWHTLQLCGHSY